MRLQVDSHHIQREKTQEVCKLLSNSISTKAQTTTKQLDLWMPFVWKVTFIWSERPRNFKRHFNSNTEKLKIGIIGRNLGEKYDFGFIDGLTPSLIRKADS